MNDKKNFENLKPFFRNPLNPKEMIALMQEISSQYSSVFSSSFGKEDQILTHLIVKNKLPVKIFTIDTGRLFNETYSLHRRTNDYYKIKIKTYFPASDEAEDLINNKGPDSFFDSIENRKECCEIRKVKPLKRAIDGHDVWFTGIRKTQSPDRAEMNIIEFDEQNNIIKIHPLLNWPDEEVEEFIKSNGVPCNILHDKGYPSIGCAPCTRAIQEGEDLRAGRWYWENGAKECGLHAHK
ncbi:MAG: phosphoadenylyl-sulfate reductase [Spirochaetia bacterium]|nr:phosphoadenylyl-sulfate reductase [Spirochaetia bacterium]